MLLENFTPDVMNKLGVGWEVLRGVNPRLIYASGSGYGLTGPDRDAMAMDLTVQAASGMMSVTGEVDGEPMKIGVALADVLTGLYAANAIQSALIHQLRTGEGQYIDMALLDVQVATLANQQGVDLNEAIQRFADGCPKCGSIPCTC